ncbi:MAG TPA: RNA polymerase sigma factor [Alloacidobacterium sp.]|nr:RNA polymerase sigma factor [Alloacidobacterium sp.]
MSTEAVYFPNGLTTVPEVRDEAPDSQESLSCPSGNIREEPVGKRLPDISDEQLLEQVHIGSKEALGGLFRRYGTAVRNVAYRILRDEAEADDLVQEVFLFIFRKATLYNAANGRAATWIIHVAYHRAFDRRRHLNSRRFYANQELNDACLSITDPKQEAPFYERTLEGTLGKKLLAEFDSELTPEQRETIRLFFFEGYALKEIAQLTGRSLSNVRSHYYRGLERLRKYVLPKKLRSK